MPSVIEKRYPNKGQVLESLVPDEEANAAIANPAFREISSFAPMFKEIKDETGVDVVNYTSLKDYFFAYYSTFETEVLEEYRRVSVDEPNKTLEAVLEARMMDGTNIHGKYLTN